MRRIIVLSAASLALLVSVAMPLDEGSAQISPAAEVESLKLIDACWAISKAKRASGVTTIMREGALDSALCLEEVILDLTAILFEPEDLSRQEAQDRLKQIRMAYGRFYWDINNAHRGCKPQCGTMYQVIHNAEYAHLLEKIVRDMMGKRYEYKIEP